MAKKSENIDFLYKYMNNPSPTGFEKDGQKLWSDYIKPFVDEVHSDLYGTAYGIINPGNDFSLFYFSFVYMVQIIRTVDGVCNSYFIKIRNN